MSATEPMTLDEMAECKRVAEAVAIKRWAHKTDHGQIGSIESVEGAVVAQTQEMIEDGQDRAVRNESRQIRAAHIARMDPQTTLRLIATVETRDAEIARMRGALKEIAVVIPYDHPDSILRGLVMRLRDIARAALEGK